MIKLVFELPSVLCDLNLTRMSDDHNKQLKAYMQQCPFLIRRLYLPAMWFI